MNYKKTSHFMMLFYIMSGTFLTNFAQSFAPRTPREFDIQHSSGELIKSHDYSSRAVGPAPRTPREFDIMNDPDNFIYHSDGRSEVGHYGSVPKTPRGFDIQKSKQLGRNE